MNNNMNLVNITIDNINLIVKKNTTIIQACLVLKKQQNKDTNEKEIAIPRFCFHQELEIAGNCRMCLVELVNSPKPVVACAMQVNDKMIIKTDTVLVKKAREGVLEFFLINHPLDCPVCDQGGECDLQDQVDVFGIDKSRFNEYKRAVTYKSCSPFIKMVMTRCIHCTRCIRFLTEIAGIHNFCLVGRGNQMEIGQFVFKNLKSELSGNIVDLCPVGALTSKTSAFKLRFWELTKKETVDVLDNIGADIRVDLRGTEILRILPRLNKDVNNNWITDVTRYAFDALVVQRFVQPYYREDIKYNIDKLLCKTGWADILELYWKYNYINNTILKKKINYSFLSSTFGDTISNVAIKQLGNSLGSSYHESRFEDNKFNNVDFRQYYITNWNKIDFNNIEVFVFVGLNLRLEAPLLNIKLRKLKKTKNISIFSFTNSVNLLYYVKHIGTSVKSFVRFLEGRHYFSNFLINNNSNTFFLLGSSILRRKDAASFIYGLEYFKNNLYSNISFGIVQNYIGRITGAEIGLIPGSSYYQNNNKSLQKKITNSFFQEAIKFLFIFSGDDYKKLNLNNFNSFNVFVGPQSENLINDVDMVLPSTNHLEKSTSYLNVEGVARFSEIVIKLLEHAHDDWRVTFLLFLKLSKSENLIKYLDNSYAITNYYFINYYFFSKKNNWNKGLKTLFFNFNVINSLKSKLKKLNNSISKKRYRNKLGNEKLFWNFNLIFNLNYKNNDLSSAKIYILNRYYKLLEKQILCADLMALASYKTMLSRERFLFKLNDIYFIKQFTSTQNSSFWMAFSNDAVNATIFNWDWVDNQNDAFACKETFLEINTNIYYSNLNTINSFFKGFYKLKNNNFISLNKKVNKIKTITNKYDLNLVISKIVQYSNVFFDNNIIQNITLINYFKLIFSVLHKNVFDLKYNNFNINILNINLLYFINILIFKLLNINTHNNNIKFLLLNLNTKYNNKNIDLLFLNVFINNFVKDFKYKRLNSANNLYYTDNIDKTLTDKLSTYSRIFNTQNQYYVLNNSNNVLLLKNKIQNKYIFNNYPINSYMDNFYKTNVISSLSPRIRASALRYKYKILFSNYL
jgi:NADH-quinone oxidoreductase subunit G